MQVRSLASVSELRIWHCCELWCNSQTQLGSCVAVAWIGPLAWELAYAMGVALKRKKKKGNFPEYLFILEALFQLIGELLEKEKFLFMLLTQ